VGMHDNSNQDTHFYPLHNNSFSSSDDNNRSAALWADHRWNAEMLESTTRPVLSSPSHPPGIALPRTAWVRLNRLRTGVGRFRSNLQKCMAASGLVECGLAEFVCFRSNLQKCMAASGLVEFVCFLCSYYSLSSFNLSPASFTCDFQD